MTTPAQHQPLGPRERKALTEALQSAHERTRRECASGILPFLNSVVIDRAGEPKPYREVAEPWQWSLAARMVPALESIAGVRKGYTGPRNFWFTLPRGHDKTSLIGRLAMWVLAFSRYAIRGVVAAADKEQANLLLEFAQAEARINAWLSPLLKFSNWRIDGVGGSRLRALAADAHTSFGLREDLFLIDELTWHAKRDLFDALISGKDKRPGAVFIIISNAGVKKSWQHQIYEAACASRDWYTYSAPVGVKLASWLSAERLAETRKLMPPGLARRVLDNEWINPGENAGFVTPEEAAACEDPSLCIRERGVPGTNYVAGLDFGVVRDRCVLTVMHMADDGCVVLDRMDVMEGSHDRRVPVVAVEAWIDRVRRDFFCPTLVADPYNLEGTLQKYQGLMDVVRFEPRGGKSNYELASNLRSLVVNQRLRAYSGAGAVIVGGRHHTFFDELSELLVEHKVYGYRLQHSANSFDDRCVSVGMAALHLCQTQGAVKISTGARWF